MLPNSQKLSKLENFPQNYKNIYFELQSPIWKNTTWLFQSTVGKISSPSVTTLCNFILEANINQYF
jgi:hypothetical protein